MIGPSLELLISDRIFPSLSLSLSLFTPIKYTSQSVVFFLQVLEAIVWTFGRLRHAEHLQRGREASKSSRASKLRERDRASIMYVCTFGDTVFVTKCVGTLLLCVLSHTYGVSTPFISNSQPLHPQKKKRQKIRIEKSPHTLRKEKTF
jgi:hypothetical protein